MASVEFRLLTGVFIGKQMVKIETPITKDFVIETLSNI